MKQTAVVVAIEIAILAILVIISASVFLGSRDEFTVKRHFNLALDYYYSGNWNEALTESEFCSETKPDYAPPYQAAGAIYLAKGDYESAERVYSASIENAGDDALPVSDLGLNVAGAMRAAKEGDMTALKQFVDAIDSFRHDVEYESDVLVSSAAVKVTIGDNSGARLSLSPLQGKEGTVAGEAVPIWYNTRAILEYDNDRKDEAMKLLRSAASMIPEWKTPVANLSAMSIETVIAEDTVKEVLIKLLAELMKTDTSAFIEEQAYAYHNTLAVISYMRLGKGYFASSIRQFDKAITIMPAKPEAKISKAVVLILESMGSTGDISGHLKEADRLLEEVLKITEDDKSARYYCYVSQGLLSIVQTEPKKAVERLKQALEVNADDYLAHRGLGSVYLSMEQYEPARIQLERSNELRDGQEDVKKALEVLRAVPMIESANLRYTAEARPAVGIRVTVHSSPTTLEDSRIKITFDDVPAFFKVRPSFVTCAPVSKLEEGEHKVNVSVTDAAGNETTKVFDLSVDRTKPVIEGVRPKEKGAVQAPMPKIIVKIFDELSEVDVSTVILKYMTGPGMDAMISQDVVKFGRYMYDIPNMEIEKDKLWSGDTVEFTPKTKLGPGNYRIQAEAKDVLGNKAFERYDFVITE